MHKGTKEGEKTIHGRHYKTGAPTTLLIDGGEIVAMQPFEGPHDDLPWIAPALFDVQVNGFGGHDLNSPDTTVDDVRAVAACLWRGGVGSWCPTITTGSHDRMLHCLRTVARACRQDERVASSVAGMHVEGPFISPRDGPRGAHPREHVRPPDWDEWQRLQDAAEGRVAMVTLAPEADGAIRLIERLTGAGVVVALGHHAAPAEAIRAAVAAGARMCTHLGNGAHATLPRHPNYIWEQLGCDDLHASIIADGHHLPPTVVRCFVRAKGVDRTILTSDAVWVAGLLPGRYRFMGEDVELLPGRKVVLAGTPYLAGSALQLSEGVGNACRFADISLGDAIDMAARNPARLLGGLNSRGELEPGRRADILSFDWHGDERVLRPRTLLLAGEPAPVELS